MSETNPASSSASANKVDHLAIGRWPVVNLIVLEAEDFAKERGKGDQATNDALGDDAATRGGSWVFRVHMDILLHTAAHYNKFRAELKKSRKDARKYLDDNGLLPAPTPEAQALIDAVLPR